MVVRIYSPHLLWTPGDLRVAEALGAEVNKWRGTPYESGQSFPKLGADCTGSIFGIVDGLDGRTRMEPAGFPHDGSLHNRKAAVVALREIVRRYSPCEKLPCEEDGSFIVEPGDIVVTGVPGGGPGHVELVGPNPNELWHSLPAAGFHQGGWSFLTQQVLWAIYRIGDKWRWTNA